MRSRSNPRLWCVSLVLVMAFSPSGRNTAHAQSRAAQFSEDEVKAAFLYRFPGYIQWPAMRGEAEPFVVAVMGDDGVAEQLRRLVGEREIKGRAVELRRVDRAVDAAEAQMLFVGADFAGDLATVTTTLSGLPIVIVTEVPQGLTKGATLNFLRVGRRVQFEVSLDAAEAAGLKIMSELLSVARRVLHRNSSSDASCQRMPLELQELHEECRAASLLAAPSVAPGLAARPGILFSLAE